ncbi:hypothetical protein PV797_00340 [Clostridiaceae bacterium M8S5]|nr:hypothetical protein PV797_00340 [Clostridiaceae bacterium M8S5]
MGLNVIALDKNEDARGLETANQSIVQVTAITDKEEIRLNLYRNIISRGEEDSIIEQFISGFEYGIDGIINDGKVYIILIRKNLTPIPYRQEIDYIYPVSVDD